LQPPAIGNGLYLIGRQDIGEIEVIGRCSRGRGQRAKGLVTVGAGGTLEAKPGRAGEGLVKPEAVGAAWIFLILVSFLQTL
jgi:hypothetical protein